MSSPAPHQQVVRMEADILALEYEIAPLAFDKWVKKGCPPNTQLADWLEAESEIRELIQFACRLVQAESGETRNLLQAIMDNARAVIYVKDALGRYLLVNRWFETLFHTPLAKIAGKTDFELFSREYAAAFRANDLRVLNRGQAIEFEETVPHADGMHTYISIKFPIAGSNGSPFAVCGISTDITERKRVEEQVKNSEALYHSLVENLPQSIFRKDRLGRFTFANKHFLSLVGKPLAQIIGKTDGDLFPPELARKYRQDDLNVMATGQTLETVEEHCPPGGGRYFVQVIKTPLHDYRQHIVGTQGIFWDVTERKRSEQRSAAEHAVARVLAEADDLGQAAPRILEAICASLGWDVGVFWEVDRQHGFLRCVEVWHSPDVSIAAFERVSRDSFFVSGVGLPGRVWASGEPALIRDVLDDANFPRVGIARQLGLHGAMGFPVRNGNEVLAVLEFLNREHLASDSHLLEMMFAVSNQISQFLERRQAERSLHERAMEFRLARQIQQGLLPACPPDVPGFVLGGTSQPAQETGGDYLDFIAMPAGHLGIVIGDASGHGIGAALLMAQTRAYLRAFARTHTNVSRAVTLANRRLVEDAGEGHFVTLFFGRLHPPTRRLVYCNAGHLPGYVLDAGGRVRATLKSTAIPLGIEPGARFPYGGALTLQSGDLIVLFTDGISEAFPADGEAFGVERILELARNRRDEQPAGLVDALLHAVRQHCRNEKQADDRSVIILKALGDTSL